MQHHRLREVCERHTRRERRRKCLSAGSADLIRTQAVKAVLKPRTNSSWAVNIVGHTFYIAQYAAYSSVVSTRHDTSAAATA